MTHLSCGFDGNREEAVVAYLYDDMPSRERASFERHLSACARCREDVESIGEVRTALAEWSPPDLPSLSAASGRSPIPPPGPGGWWHAWPVWAQVAAAALFIGVSAAIANLDVTYGAGGLSVRTGWSGLTNMRAARATDGSVVT